MDLPDKDDRNWAMIAHLSAFAYYITGIVPGPYRITAYDSADALVLDRNPFFREWSADAQPDGFPAAYGRNQ